MQHAPATMSTEPPIPAELTVMELAQRPQRGASERLCVQNPARIQAALALLLDAKVRADDVAVDPWQFSVELAALRRMGVTGNECRWLVAKGFARHACEITTHDAARRAFRPCLNLAFPKGTCFVIEEAGIAYAGTQCPRDVPRTVDRVGAPDFPASVIEELAGYTEPKGPTPIWDPDRQQLRVGKAIVKEFKVPAANQEAILAAFQEDGWAPRIDDPLPPNPNQDSKRRLHDTINSLNRNQKNALVRFLGDGKGEGVRWEFEEDCQRPNRFHSVRNGR